ncbi:MAG: DUF2442 domain-containing protein [Leptospirales bacterium]
MGALPSETATPKNSTSGVIAMKWDVMDVKAEKHLRLLITFEDGTSGRVTFCDDHLTGVFAPLKNPEFFSKVFIDHGAVAWPGDIDLAPDAMYREIREKGECVLG